MYCILIAGMPASGKSRFAEWLSAHWALPCMSKDGIKELLFDTLGFKSRAEKVQLGVAAERTLLEFAKAQLDASKPFMVENNFERATWYAWHELIAHYDCHAVTVLFDGDIDAIYRRMTARDSTPGRHRGHIVNTRYPGDDSPYVPPRPEDFRAGVEMRGFRNFELGETLRVDSTDLKQVDYEKIERALYALIHESE